ncbi:MAG: AbrB/MazE/SpoVT family DNA-binding domain-containing protein [Bacteroidota bacterium]|jgi:antitoxin MazE|nr:AbrB/MazE/SpoVT family DNA-binding domain-containing protein [Bacteroidota bacterium]
MKARIRIIGNSQGIILPKEVIERCKLQEEVEITVSGDHIIIQAPKYKRSSWEATFKKAVGKEEGVLDNADLILNDWDNKEWEW